MLSHDSFWEERTAIASSFRVKYLLVLYQLHFIVVDSFTKVVSHAVTIFDVMELLKAINSNREYLTTWLEDRAVLSA